MNRLAGIKAREVLDSRGLPTVEVDATLDSGHSGRMIVPSGASTGHFEAYELRDGDPTRFQGKGVQRAVAHVNNELSGVLRDIDPEDQELVDRTMIDLDGTDNKRRLGANALLGVSFAVARACASSHAKPFYRYLADRYLEPDTDLCIPMPMVNIISGGLHAGKCVDIQDYLVMPLGADSYPRSLEMISSIWWATREILQERGYTSSLVADEGGFGPRLDGNEAPLEVLCAAMDRVGLRPFEDIAIALDVAASHFYDPQTHTYGLQADNETLDAPAMIDRLSRLVEKYPIVSIEDGIAEDDWSDWTRLTSALGARIQIVGDDLFTTNPERIRKGAEVGAANAVLIKNNQIGTLTETVEAVRASGKAGFKTVISARSGETEDAVLADLAVGLGGDQIKIGSITRSSRLSKYNQLLRIGEDLDGAFANRSSVAFA
jgi:enolase